MIRHYLLFHAVLVAAISTIATQAITDEELSRLQQALNTVPIPELPRRAAEVVFKSKASERDEVAAAVIRTIASRRPGAVAAVVATVSSANPSVAATVAGTATRQIPSEAAVFARVATEAAPEHAGDIAAKTGQRGGGNGKGNGHGQQNGPGNGNGTFDPKGPKIDPPAHGVIENRPGTIRGNRPAFPPGLVRNPKPGRDHERDNYGRP
jgi:hypothetical protein